jgi:hypothetical protein
MSLEGITQLFCKYRAINIDTIVLTYLKSDILVRNLLTRFV